MLDPPPSPQQRKRVGAPFGSADEIEEAFLLASGRRDFLNWFLGSAFGTLVLWILYPVARFVSTPAISESTAAQVEAGATNDTEPLRQPGVPARPNSAARPKSVNLVRRGPRREAPTRTLAGFRSR